MLENVKKRGWWTVVYMAVVKFLEALGCTFLTVEGQAVTALHVAKMLNARNLKIQFENSWLKKAGSYFATMLKEWYKNKLYD